MKAARSNRIFNQYVIDELTHNAVTTFTALFAVLLITQLISLQREVVGGKLVATGVLALVGFGAVQQFAIVLAITLFVTVLTSLSRQHRDSEFVVWAANGRSIKDWIGPVLAFSMPFVAAIALLSVVIAPWSREQSQVFREHLKARAETDTGYLSPGTFRNLSGGRVVYVESVTDKDEMRGIFAYGVDKKGREHLVLADKGYAANGADGRNKLLLHQGRLYEKKPDGLSYSQMAFETLSIDPGDVRVNEFVRTVKNASLFSIMGDSTAESRGEILWRFSVPLASVLLVLMAIPLSYTNPRSAQIYNFVLAIMIYLVYGNFINIAQSWLERDKIPLLLAWIFPHGLMALCTLIMFIWRFRQPRPLFSRRRA